jgi:uncharacterized protein YbgA (DUF1722 family)/uncharacterized protein YbbK (DUF523 family)
LTEFALPRVVISRCIDFDSCRYNGQVVRASLRDDLQPHVEFVPVCPELEIGLGVPRDPIRMVTRPDRIGLVQPATGRDLTDAMDRFASRFLAGLGEVDGFILKSRSPSCGLRGVNIYDSSDQDAVVSSGAGRFAAPVLERFPHIAVEDEGRLRNLRLREHFLSRIFTSASFRAVRAEGKLGALVRFHARNKLLLMAHSEMRLRRLGRIVANAAREPLVAVLARYEVELAPALAAPARAGAQINVIMHALGHVSDGLGSAEKGRFLDSLDSFRAWRLPLSAILELLRSWAARFDDRYLAEQTFLTPFPPELIRIEPAGRKTRR